MATKSRKNGSAAAGGAQVMAELSDVVAIAGMQDVAQGSEALAAAQEIEVQSDIVAALSSDDLERSMALGAIAGQIGVASEIVYSLQMPELGAFLRTKSEELHAIAVVAVKRFGATRVLSAAMAESSNQIGALGANEMLEGMARQEIADAMAEVAAERSDDETDGATA